MPIYDYVCSNGHVVEVVHGVHDPGPSACPRCGAPMRKRLAPPAIHFRGSGWAKKDARAASGRHRGRSAGHEAAHGEGAGHEKGPGGSASAED